MLDELHRNLLDFDTDVESWPETLQLLARRLVEVLEDTLVELKPACLTLAKGDAVRTIHVNAGWNHIF